MYYFWYHSSACSQLFSFFLETDHSSIDLSDLFDIALLLILFLEDVGREGEGESCDSVCFLI